MKFVDEYRDPAAARLLVTQIEGVADPQHRYKLMEVCGGHTHTIYRHGIEQLLPDNVELVHGPGCPVCVIRMGRVDDAIHVAEHAGVVFTSFGDMMRVPGSGGDNLLAAKAPRALRILAEVFALRPHFEWRGLGFISQSALELRDDFAMLDAERRYAVPGVRVADPTSCHCGEVLKGVIKPWECKVFGTSCMPETPIGTCMVSSEGACAAYLNFGRLRHTTVDDDVTTLPMVPAGASGSG